MGRHRFDHSIESAVNELVEADDDRRAAQADLDRFNADKAPEPPQEFATLQALISFHRRGRDYEGALAKRQENLAAAEKRYTQAAEILREVLPENVPLKYDYAGSRTDLLGTRYDIVYRQGEVIVPKITRSPGP